MTSYKSRWFVEIFLDGETVRFWNDFETVSYDGLTFLPLGDRFTPPDRLKRTASLKSETVKLTFDSSRQLDNSDILAQLLDSTWRRRPIRIREVYFSAVPDDGDVIVDAFGRINKLSDAVGAEREPRLEMEVESGSLAYLERRMQTRTAENQKLIFPADRGFDLAKALEDVPLVWRTKHTPKGTAQVKAQSTDEPPARMLPIGEFATEGTFVAHFTNQQQKKAWMRVFAIADCRIAELSKVWVNGELMISTPLVHGVRREITQLASGGPRAWVTWYDGRHDQTADPWLVSVEPSWTTNHRLQGVSYVIMEHLWDSDNPEAYDYKFGGRGAYFYDRRKDSTAGGSGSHRLLDPYSWEYSTNVMVAADHYRQGIRIDPSKPDAMWFGVGELPDIIPYAEYMDLADHCDELVAKKAGGVQKRFEANGILSAADDHKTNLEKLASAMAARAIDQGGRIVFRPVRERAPVMTLTDGDLIRTSVSEYDPTGRIDDMANTIEGRFYDKNQAFKATDYPRVSKLAYVDQDGDVISDTRNFELEIDGERAQRLAFLEMEYSRRIATLKEVFRSSAIRELKPGDWFVRSSAMRGFAVGKTFEVEEIEKAKNGTTEVLAVEVYPDEQAWDESQAADLSIPPVVDPVTMVPLENPEVVVAQGAVSELGGVTLPGVKVSFNYGSDPVPAETQVEVARDNGSGEPDFSLEVLTRTVPAGSSFAWLAGELLPNTDYLVRIRVSYRGRHSDWSAWTPFTTPDVFVARSAISAEPGGVLATTLEAVQLAVGDATAAITAEQIARIQGDEAEAFARQTLAARVDDAEAAITNEASARSSGDSANALSISQLSAKTLNPRPNLMTRPVATSKAGYVLAAQHGWFSSGGIPGAFGGLIDIYADSQAEAVFLELWGGGLSTTEGRFHIFDLPAGMNGGVPYTLSLTGRAQSMSAGFYMFAKGASGNYLGECPVTYFDAVRSRKSVTWIPPAGTKSLSIVVYVPPQTTIAGYVEYFFNYIKLEAGDRETAFNQDATVTFLREALATGNSAKARLLLSVDTATNVATIEAVAQEGDGVWNGSKISFTADSIELNGNVLINGTLLTEKLAANAVSRISSAYTSGSITTTKGQWTTVQSVSLTSEGGSIVLAASLSAGIYVDGINNDQRVRIRRGGATVYQSDRLNVVTQGFGGQVYNSFSATAIDSPPAGVHTYTVEVYADGGTLTTSTATQRALVATELKR